MNTLEVLQALYNEFRNSTEAYALLLSMPGPKTYGVCLFAVGGSYPERGVSRGLVKIWGETGDC